MFVLISLSKPPCASVPPVIRREGVDMSPRVRANRTVTLTCQIEDGKPDPVLTWVRVVNGQERPAIQYPGVSVAEDNSWLRVRSLHCFFFFKGREHSNTISCDKLFETESRFKSQFYT